MISAPIQLDFDPKIGDEGERLGITVKPVIPFELNEDWNLITRTIAPVVWQKDVAPDSGTQFGLGDLFPSLWLSPKKPTKGGVIWGVGGAFLIPTATDPLLGAGKWGAGPTIVLLKQSRPWTFGLLANHVWSFAGKSDRDSLSNTFLQPFISYNTPTGWTFTLNTESTYDWKNDAWNVPILVKVSKVVQISNAPVQLSGGVRYWAESPEGGARGWGLLFSVTLMYPR